MKRFFKTTATLILVALSFVILVDSFICQEDKEKEAGAPVECCMQCCPRHHLAPSTGQLNHEFSNPIIEKFFVAQLIPPSALLADSIFHPPKSPLL